MNSAGDFKGVITSGDKSCPAMYDYHILGLSVLATRLYIGPITGNPEDIIEDPFYCEPVNSNLGDVFGCNMELHMCSYADACRLQLSHMPGDDIVKFSDDIEFDVSFIKERLLNYIKSDTEHESE